jgi:hypothetical protein
MGRRLAAVVAVLVLTAGCNAFAGTGGQGPASTPTLTPAPVPTDSAETPSVVAALPPGIHQNGTVDVSHLASAHEATLSGRTYTWTYRQVQRSAETDRVSVNLTRRVFVGANASLVVDERSSLGVSGAQRVSRYLTEERGYLREVGLDGTSYADYEDPRSAASYTLVDDLFESFLGDNTFQMQLLEREGRELLRLYAPPGPPPQGLFALRDSVSEFTVTAYVRPTGFVRSLTVSYLTSTPSGPDERVSVTLSYTDVGETTVTRPDWVSRVPHNGTTVTPAATTTATTAGTTSTPTATGTTPSAATSPGTTTNGTSR